MTLTVGDYGGMSGADVPVTTAFRRRAHRRGVRSGSGELPTASLAHHVARGDFPRWARDVLADADLAAGLAKLETAGAIGAPVEREKLRRHLHARYVV